MIFNSVNILLGCLSAIMEDACLYNYTDSMYLDLYKEQLVSNNYTVDVQYISEGALSRRNYRK